MDFIDLKYAKRRLPENMHLDSLKLTETWDPSENIFKLSSCELEIDSWPSEILNRLQVKERDALTPSGSKIEKPLVSSLAAIWEEENRRRILEGLPHIKPTGHISSCQRDAYTPWPNEDRLKDKFHDTLRDLDRLGIRSSGPNTNHLKDIPTAYQATAALHMHTMNPIDATPDSPDAFFQNHDVNYAMLSQARPILPQYQVNESLISQLSCKNVYFVLNIRLSMKMSKMTRN